MGMVWRTNKKSVLLLYAFSIAQMGLKYVEFLTGRTSIRGNARGVWIPMANKVLSGGQLYLDQWDNKPPLFQFLNVLIYGTGNYVLVYYLLIALANATTGVLIWQFLRNEGQDRVGMIAAILFLTSLQLIFGLVINPRPFGTVAMMAAFVIAQPIHSGIAIAVAGLFSQYYVLAIPSLMVLIKKRLTNGYPLRSFSLFCAAGLVIVVLSYGAVASIWSVESGLTGFKYTFFALSDYTAGYTERGMSLWGDPMFWLYETYVKVSRLYFIFIPAAIAIVSIRRADFEELSPTVIALLASIGLLGATMIRPTDLYYLPAMPWLAILAAKGLVLTYEQAEFGADRHT